MQERSDKLHQSLQGKNHTSSKYDHYLLIAANIFNQWPLISTRAGVNADFKSNQAETTPNSSCLISSSWSPISYQVCLPIGCYESLQLHRPLVVKIENLSQTVLFKSSTPIDKCTFISLGSLNSALAELKMIT